MIYVLLGEKEEERERKRSPLLFVCLYLFRIQLNYTSNKEKKLYLMTNCITRGNTGTENYLTQ